MNNLIQSGRGEMNIKRKLLVLCLSALGGGIMFSTHAPGLITILGLIIFAFSGYLLTRWTDNLIEWKKG